MAGLVDALADAAIPAFGPTAAAARVEGSKVHAKELMAAAGVPTGAFAMAATVDDGLAAIGGSYPAVLKYDGLAAGKGVVIAEDEDAARRALEDFLVHRSFGDGAGLRRGAPHRRGAVAAGALRRRAGDPDGARARTSSASATATSARTPAGWARYSPVPGAGDAHELSAIVHQPLVDELRRRGTPFHGVLYAGLMLTPDGPRVIEYNARFGDPETQAVLPRLRSDLLELLRLAASPGGLEGATLDFTDDAAVTVVLASGGYPASSSSGDVISGLDDVGDGVELTHAGTARRDDGAIVTAGGRVLNITALGPDIGAARDAAYAAADLITFEGRQLRRDIALRAVERT